MKNPFPFLILTLIVIFYSGCKKEDVSSVRNAEKPGGNTASSGSNIKHNPLISNLESLVSGKYVVSGSLSGWADICCGTSATILNDTIIISSYSDSSITVSPPRTYIYTYYDWNGIPYTPNVTTGLGEPEKYEFSNNEVQINFSKVREIGSLSDSTYISSINISAYWVEDCGNADEIMSVSGRKID